MLSLQQHGFKAHIDAYTKINKIRGSDLTQRQHTNLVPCKVKAQCPVCLKGVDIMKRKKRGGFVRRHCAVCEANDMQAGGNVGVPVKNDIFCGATSDQTLCGLVCMGRHVPAVIRQRHHY